MPRISRAERVKRGKALKLENGKNADNSRDITTTVPVAMREMKSNNEIACLHKKPQASKHALQAKGSTTRAIAAAVMPSAAASSLGGSSRLEVGKKRPRSEGWDADDGQDTPTVPAVVDELVATIEEHDQLFSRMLDMIPQHLVLPAKEVPEVSYASKYMKNKKGAAPQQSKKEESKKNKRARYSADNQKTVLEQQQMATFRRNRHRLEQQEIHEKERAREESGEGDVDDGKEDNIEESEDEDDGEGEGLPVEMLRRKNMDVASMDALKKRIEARIKEFQQKRTAAEGSRRAKTADKRSAQVSSKREKKKKGVKGKKKGDKAATAAEATTEARAGAKSANTAVPSKASKKEVNGSHIPTLISEPELPPLPTVEDVGDIEFSGLRGVALQNKRKLPPTMGAPGSKMRRLHGLLAAAEEKKQRLAALRQSEEGKEKAKQEVWGDAIRVAGGEELKDNPAALKKTIKRKEKDKAKSAKEWDKRLAGQKKDQSARQSKREENLNKKKQGGLVADSAAAGDGAEAAGGKRQRRAGFEGKKQDFINKERPKGSGREGGGGRGGERNGGRGRGGRGRGGRGGRGGGRG